MSNPVRIHADKTPKRVHYIVEWAAHRNMRQKDIVRELGVDKGLVSRWWGGTIPKYDYLEALAGLFQLDDISSLFRHPDDDWITRMFRDRSEEQRQQALDMLKILFNDKPTGTDG
ncbi:helix-turn-helix domain-containing protein [Martelella sp. AMO21009]